MAFAFETHVLPLLREMAANPLTDDYPFKQRARELGLAADDDQADRLLELVRNAGYLSFKGQQTANGAWLSVFDVRITAKALRQLDLWPADDQRALLLLGHMADALELTADDIGAAVEHDPGQPGRIRAAARALREVGVDVAARFMAEMASGG